MFESVAYAMAQGQQGAGGGGGSLAGFLPLILLIVIFYFLLIRPQQKKQKALRDLHENLKVGDRVVTSGGIHGTVAAVSGRVVTLKVAEKVKIEVDRSAIAGLRSSQTEASGSGGSGTA